MYQYKDLEKFGYTRIYLTKSQHNKIFKCRQIKFGDRYEYYLNDEIFVMRKFYSVAQVIVCTLLFPVSVLLNGFASLKDNAHEHYRLFHQKETGLFSEDFCNSGSDTYKEIVENIRYK